MNTSSLELTLTPAGQILYAEYQEITQESTSINLTVIEQRISQIIKDHLPGFTHRDYPLFQAIQKKLTDHNRIDSPVFKKIENYLKIFKKLTANPFEILKKPKTLVDPLEYIFKWLPAKECQNLAISCKKLVKRTSEEIFISNVVYRKLEGREKPTSVDDYKKFQKEFGHHLPDLPYFSMVKYTHKNSSLYQEFMNMSISDLKEIISCSPKLNVLDLTDFTQLADYELADIGNLCPSLQRLSLHQCIITKNSDIKTCSHPLELFLFGVTDDKILKRISLIFSAITNLRISQCGNLTSKGFKMLLKSDELSVLDIRCDEWFNKAIITSLAKFSKLKKISLKDFWNCSSEALKNLKALGKRSSLEEVKVANLSGFLPFSENKLKFLPGIFPNVSRFVCEAIGSSPEEFTAVLQMCPNMQTLSLQVSNIDFSSLGDIPSSITTLEFLMTKPTSDEVTALVKKCPNLQAIRIWPRIIAADLISELIDKFPNLDVS